ncbi:protease modulator HflK [Rhizobium sp. ICMP 5592]|uniref:protease modulator HflK n=1 Tax=Rhizobium sp. ICMP 5592 TaxID=2292445 RepID=UPI001294D729|nr:protease modulator HflK [Rhizobium sp. ICMP 5592]MQB44841.1 protease modulator HflK [Rhizobium sp. ICMP 5592]
MGTVGDRNSTAQHQAVRLVSMLLSAIMVLAAVGWATSNIREIAPQNRAVVFRLGALDRVQESGLLWALPAPFEKVLLLPDAATVLERRIDGLLRSPTAQAGEADAATESDTLAGSGYLLTADASVVQLDIRVFYRVTDPFAYALQQDHILPALDRLVTRSAVVICASRDLDSILVARPELVSADSDVAERREQLRADLVNSINTSLTSLKSKGMGLGIEIDRADVQSALPTTAVSAFDGVLTASQQAEQAIASAQNDAEKDRQAADQEADRIVQVAEAQSSERLAKARADTATVTGFASAQGSDSDPGLLWRLYRDRVAKILSQAGSVVTVDPRDDARLILQGADK